jgi:2-polyprenyl-3-methyl-5-hydroxy-6-metoxy-1,4-benzoquinol methylase
MVYENSEFGRDRAMQESVTQSMPLNWGDLPVLPTLDARIPKWSLDNLEARACPFCAGTNQAELRRPDGLPVAFCDDCNLWYVAGLPPAEEIRNLYQGYWYSFRPRDLSESYAAGLLADTRTPKSDMRLNRLSALAGGLEGKRLLDVGCGCGEVLVRARHRGASVFGNDISAEACAFVKDKLGVPVLEGPLSDSSFVAEFGQMDMVVMSDLIEHPTDPLSMFVSALRILTPGGLLLIHTPNGGAASDPGGANKWVGFRVDLEHLQYLSTGTVSVLANRYGCRIEHLETFGYPGLQGIDSLPATAPQLPAKSILRRQLKKSTLLRKIVETSRLAHQVFREADPDVRSGTYHLFAILRAPVCTR